MFEFASALGTVGLSIGVTSYGAAPIILWTASVGMFIGRLEIYIVFIAMARIGKDIGNRFERERMKMKHELLRSALTNFGKTLLILVLTIFLP
jgi:trk system potassium uptake protein TrkH